MYEWYHSGIPKVFWIGAFFHLESFLTGVLQNYSRKQKISIDRLGFDFRPIPVFKYKLLKVGD